MRMPGIEGNGHDAEIAQLERRLAAPAWIEEARSAVNNDADAAEAGTAFEAAQDVVVQFERLLGNSEGKLARLQDERLARFDDAPFASDPGWRPSRERR